MAHPKLPYWFHAGRVSTPIAGPVYVLKDDETVIESPGSTVLTPRMRFFASQQSVSHLVSRGLVKRLPQPKEPKPKEEAAPAPAAPSKSPEPPKAKPAPAPARAAAADDVSVRTGGSDASPRSDVVASDAGDGEAGKQSVPEEKETAKPDKRRSRRS